MNKNALPIVGKVVLKFRKDLKAFEQLIEHYLGHMCMCLQALFLYKRDFTVVLLYLHNMSSNGWFSGICEQNKKWI